MAEILLCPAVEADTEALATLGRNSFVATFGHLYRAQDLADFIEQAYAPAAVAQEIADSAIVHCLARDSAGGPLTGYCKLRHPSWYAEYSNATNPIALGQLYTAAGRTGEGIGAALMDWALAEARGRQCDAVQLSVWSGNHGAQRFYARYGFRKIADIDFWVGNHRDDEYLYELSPVPGIVI